MADLAAPRALGRAVMRIESDAGISELGHVGAADHHKTGTAQTRDRGSIGLGARIVVERTRPGAGDLPLDIEQILDRDRNAGKGRRRGIGFAQRVHRLGRGDRAFGIDLNERARALAAGIVDPGQTLIDQLTGTGAAGFQIRGERGEGRMLRHDHSTC